MKKKVLGLMLSLIMAISFASCGSESSGKDNYSERESSDESDEKETKEETKEEETTEVETSSEADSEDSALAEWYNSADRTTLEDTINSMFEGSGMTFFVTIEEPDTIIYNYQYQEQIDFSDVSEEEIKASYKASLDAGVSAIISDLNAYQLTYGIPLKVIRLTYINADGTLICSLDVTEDYEAGAASDTDAVTTGTQNFDSLQEWIDSEEKRLVVDTVNEMLASSNLVYDMRAEDDVLVMEYTYLEQIDFGDMTQEDIDALFNESIAPLADNLATSFQSSYGFTVSDVCLIIYNLDGTKIYEKNISEI